MTTAFTKAGLAIIKNRQLVSNPCSEILFEHQKFKWGPPAQTVGWDFSGPRPRRVQGYRPLPVLEFDGEPGLSLRDGDSISLSFTFRFVD